MNILVVGTGVMGKGIVSYLATCSHVSTIYWKGSTIGKAERELLLLPKALKRVIKKRHCDFSDAISKVRAIDSFDGMDNVELIIETICENLLAKKSVYDSLRNYVNDNTIIATNTSSISITSLANNINFPSRFIGLHFFNPIEMMGLVEIIRGYHTSEETVNWVAEFISNTDKKAITLNESPGFIVNRMLMPMINEAITLLAEGVASKDDIDNAMKLGANHPLGPLALADLIGNDIVLSIMQSLFDETNDPKYRPHPLLKKTVRAGALGRKSKYGFHNY